MKQLVCEACGGKELIRQGNVLVCSHCDTKYSVKEEKNDLKININFEQEPFETITEFFETRNEHFKTKTEESDFDWKILFYLSFFFRMAWCR